MAFPQSLSPTQIPKFRSKRKLHSHFPEKSENTFSSYLEPLEIEGPTVENTKICIETPLKSLVDCRTAHNGRGGSGGGRGYQLKSEKAEQKFPQLPVARGTVQFMSGQVIATFHWNKNVSWLETQLQNQNKDLLNKVKAKPPLS